MIYNNLYYVTNILDDTSYCVVYQIFAFISVLSDIYEKKRLGMKNAFLNIPKFA